MPNQPNTSMSTSAEPDQLPAPTVLFSNNDEDNKSNNNNTDDGDITMDEEDQHHHHQINLRPISAISPVSSRSPLSSTSTDPRRLFQRLWTEDDEIRILEGFLDFTKSRGGNTMASHQYDTGAFYSQIRAQIRLDFTKSQLVEKLRRIKKKYRKNFAKMAPRGTKDFFFAFKTAHDRKAFEISDKIWGDASVVFNSTVNSDEEEEEEAEPIHGGATEVLAPVPMMTSAVLAVPAPANNPNCKNEVSNRGDGGDDVVTSDCRFGIGLPTKNLELGEKWKNQQMLELEVFSKRLELLQEEIKSALIKLRNGG